MGKIDDGTKTQNVSTVRGLPPQTHQRKATGSETSSEVGWRAVCGESRKHGSEGGQGFLRVRLPYPTITALPVITIGRAERMSEGTYREQCAVARGSEAGRWWRLGERGDGRRGHRTTPPELVCTTSRLGAIVSTSRPYSLLVQF